MAPHLTRLLVGLKLSLLRNGWRTSLGQRIGMVVGALFGAGTALFGVIAVLALRAADPGWAAFGVLVGGSVLVLGWALVPVLVSGVDETLDPARFALLPLRARRLAPGLLVAGLIGVPGVVTSLLALATIVTWSRGVAPVLLAVPAAVVGVLTCVMVSRLLTTAAARLLAARRSREVGTIITVLLLSTLGLWPTLLSSRSWSVTEADQITEILGWTPLGLPWAAPADAATGHLARGLLRLVLATALLVAEGLLWSVLLDRALVEQTDGGGTRAEVGRRSALDRLPATPVWAVAGRSLRYWRRDPRYFVAVIGIMVSGIVPVVLIQVQSTGTHAVLLAAGPFVGSLLGITTANDLGTDGSAFATHLLVGVPGRVDRLGRALAVLCWGVPLITVIAVAGAVLGGRGELWAGALGAALGGLFGGLGASSVSAALVPFPVAAAGGNPFRSNSGGSARAALGQFAVMGVTSGAALPGVVLLLVAALAWPPAAYVGLVVGPAVGLAVLAAGIVLGGRTLDARGPEILAIVRKPI